MMNSTAALRVGQAALIEAGRNLTVSLGHTFDLIFLLDGVRVGGFLGALRDRLHAAECRLPGALVIM